MIPEVEHLTFDLADVTIQAVAAGVALWPVQPWNMSHSASFGASL
jgi:hypothetical protein